MYKLQELRDPPKIKILEAAGSIADNRIKIDKTENNLIVAKVISSEGDRKYNVIIKNEGNNHFKVYSDDNGTKLRGYVGYPIIAVLMLANILPRDKNVEESLKGVEWRKLNETYKKYAIVEEIVLKNSEKLVPKSYILEFRKNVLNELEKLKIELDDKLLEENA
ncbi:MAG: hypothetical protein ACP5I6_01665 [Caldisphaera sp.]